MPVSLLKEKHGSGKCAAQERFSVCLTYTSANGQKKDKTVVLMSQDMVNLSHFQDQLLSFRIDFALGPKPPGTRGRPPLCAACQS